MAGDNPLDAVFSSSPTPAPTSGGNPLDAVFGSPSPRRLTPREINIAVQGSAPFNPMIGGNVPTPGHNGGVSQVSVPPRPKLTPDQLAAQARGEWTPPQPKAAPTKGLFGPQPTLSQALAPKTQPKQKTAADILTHPQREADVHRKRLGLPLLADQPSIDIRNNPIQVPEFSDEALVHALRSGGSQVLANDGATTVSFHAAFGDWARRNNLTPEQATKKLAQMGSLGPGKPNDVGGGAYNEGQATQAVLGAQESKARKSFDPNELATHMIFGGAQKTTGGLARGLGGGQAYGAGMTREQEKQATQMTGKALANSVLAAGFATGGYPLMAAGVALGSADNAEELAGDVGNIALAGALHGAGKILGKIVQPLIAGDQASYAATIKALGLTEKEGEAIKDAVGVRKLAQSGTAQGEFIGPMRPPKSSELSDIAKKVMAIAPDNFGRAVQRISGKTGAQAALKGWMEQDLPHGNFEVDPMTGKAIVPKAEPAPEPKAKTPKPKKSASTSDVTPAPEPEPKAEPTRSGKTVLEFKSENGKKNSARSTLDSPPDSMQPGDIVKTDSGAQWVMKDDRTFEQTHRYGDPIEAAAPKKAEEFKSDFAKALERFKNAEAPKPIKGERRGAIQGPFSDEHIAALIDMGKAALGYVKSAGTETFEAWESHMKSEMGPMFASIKDHTRELWDHITGTSAAPKGEDPLEALPEGATGARRAITDAERKARKEQPVSLNKVRGIVEHIDEAHAEIKSANAKGLHPEQQVTRDILDGKRTASAKDQALLTVHRAMLKEGYDAIGEKIDAAMAKGDTKTAADLNKQLQDHLLEFARNDEALSIAGRQWHEAGQVRRAIVTRDMTSSLDVIREYERAMTRKATGSEVKELTNLANAHKKLQAEIKAVRSENLDLRTRIQGQRDALAGRRAIRQGKKAEILSERERLKKQFFEQLTGKASAGMDPEAAITLAKIVKTHIQEKGLSFADAWDKVFTEMNLPKEHGDAVKNAYASLQEDPAAGLEARDGRVVENIHSKIENARSSTLQKFGHEVAQTPVASALSSVTVFGKLATAVTGHAITLPLEEAINPALRKVPGLNIPETQNAGLGRYYRAFGSPANWGDAIQTVFSGSTKLEQQAISRGIENAYKKPTGPVSWLVKREVALHKAVKSFTQNAQFAMDFEKFLKDAESRKPGSAMDPRTMDAAWSHAYKGGKEGIFMNESAATKAADSALRPLDKVGVGRALAPVRHVPINFAARSLEYQLGAPYAIARYGFEMAKRGEIAPELAAKLAKSLKRGTVGGGLALGAYLAPKDALNIDDKGNLVVDGWTMPSWASHVPWLEPVRFGVKMRNGEGFVTAATSNLIDSAAHTPFVDVPLSVARVFQTRGTDETKAQTAGRAIGAIVRGAYVPQLIQKWAAMQDSNDDGETRYRKRKGFTDELMYGVPGLREKLQEDPTRTPTVLSKETAKRLAPYGLKPPSPRQKMDTDESDYETAARDKQAGEDDRTYRQRIASLQIAAIKTTDHMERTGFKGKLDDRYGKYRPDPNGDPVRDPANRKAMLQYAIRRAEQDINDKVFGVVGHMIPKKSNIEGGIADRVVKARTFNARVREVKADPKLSSDQKRSSLADLQKQYNASVPARK